MDDEEIKTRMAADLAEIARTHMPFGKFGPENFPPHGLPIYDLPAEYLQYFALKKAGRADASASCCASSIK